MLLTRLSLICHDQTPNNVDGILDFGHPGAGVTDLGRRQADAVPEALRREAITGVYVSRLIRTQQTAAPLAGNLGTTPQITEGLHEIFAGEYEMRCDQEAVDSYRHVQEPWAFGDFDTTIPGSEDGHASWDRYTGTLRLVADQHRDDETVAVVSHGAAIRVFTAFATHLASSLKDVSPVHNTGMVALTGHPD